ncbi:uncharacterized protein EV422DRAFT_536733 [Fimicolochytrium jonesii]|uniref:uncharacterized protein n=1 Tax=Fimicolochytrium jonesii TaxID=1396493 RepID=UPI0022FEEA46|nr:uncharacterized protein EV422DRAFT_536733 [Fimicolochytrium jonesii]KAI8818758.1 hypothetical protein EV422DRAFT_536733 [Fimicolochytrium jonesii]
MPQCACLRTAGRVRVSLWVLNSLFASNHSSYQAKELSSLGTRTFRTSSTSKARGDGRWGLSPLSRPIEPRKSYSLKEELHRQKAFLSGNLDSLKEQQVVAPSRTAVEYVQEWDDSASAPKDNSVSDASVPTDGSAQDAPALEESSTYKASVPTDDSAQRAAAPEDLPTPDDSVPTDNSAQDATEPGDSSAHDASVLTDDSARDASAPEESSAHDTSGPTDSSIQGASALTESIAYDDSVPKNTPNSEDLYSKAIRGIPTVSPDPDIASTSDSGGIPVQSHEMLAADGGPTAQEERADMDVTETKTVASSAVQAAIDDMFSGTMRGGKERFSNSFDSGNAESRAMPWNPLQSELVIERKGHVPDAKVPQKLPDASIDDEYLDPLNKLLAAALEDERELLEMQSREAASDASLPESTLRENTETAHAQHMTESEDVMDPTEIFAETIDTTAKENPPFDDDDLEERDLHIDARRREYDEDSAHLSSNSVDEYQGNESELHRERESRDRPEDWDEVPQEYRGSGRGDTDAASEHYSREGYGDLQHIGDRSYDIYEAAVNPTERPITSGRSVRGRRSRGSTIDDGLARNILDWRHEITEELQSIKQSLRILENMPLPQPSDDPQSREISAQESIEFQTSVLEALQTIQRKVDALEEKQIVDAKKEKVSDSQVGDESAHASAEQSVIIGGVHQERQVTTPQDASSTTGGTSLAQRARNRLSHSTSRVGLWLVDLVRSGGKATWRAMYTFADFAGESLTWLLFHLRLGFTRLLRATADVIAPAPQKPEPTSTGAEVEAPKTATKPRRKEKEFNTDQPRRKEKDSNTDLVFDGALPSRSILVPAIVEALERTGLIPGPAPTREKYSRKEIEAAADNVRHVVSALDRMVPDIVRALSEAGIRPYTTEPYHIYVMDDPAVADKFLQTVMGAAKNRRKESLLRVIGVDTETAARRGEGMKGPPSLVQIAFADTLVGIFQVHRMCDRRGQDPNGKRLDPTRFPNLLRSLLQSGHIMKTGVGVVNDLLNLKAHYGLRVGGMYIDTHLLAESMDLPARSLQALTALFCNEDLDKTRRSGSSIRWDLGPAEMGWSSVLYAANDARASLMVLKNMIRRPHAQSEGAQRLRETLKVARDDDRQMSSSSKADKAKELITDPGHDWHTVYHSYAKNGLFSGGRSESWPEAQKWLERNVRDWRDLTVEQREDCARSCLEFWKLSNHIESVGRGRWRATPIKKEIQPQSPSPSTSSSTSRKTGPEPTVSPTKSTKALGSLQQKPETSAKSPAISNQPPATKSPGTFYEKPESSAKSAERFYEMLKVGKSPDESPQKPESSAKSPPIQAISYQQSEALPGTPPSEPIGSPSTTSEISENSSPVESDVIEKPVTDAACGDSVPSEPVSTSDKKNDTNEFPVKENVDDYLKTLGVLTKKERKAFRMAWEAKEKEVAIAKGKAIDEANGNSAPPDSLPTSGEKKEPNESPVAESVDEYLKTLGALSKKQRKAAKLAWEAERSAANAKAVAERKTEMKAESEAKAIKLKATEAKAALRAKAKEATKSATANNAPKGSSQIGDSNPESQHKKVDIGALHFKSKVVKVPAATKELLEELSHDAVLKSYASIAQFGKSRRALRSIIQNSFMALRNVDKQLAATLASLTMTKLEDYGYLRRVNDHESKLFFLTLPDSALPRHLLDVSEAKLSKIIEMIRVDGPLDRTKWEQHVRSRLAANLGEFAKPDRSLLIAVILSHAIRSGYMRFDPAHVTLSFPPQPIESGALLESTIVTAQDVSRGENGSGKTTDAGNSIADRETDAVPEETTASTSAENATKGTARERRRAMSRERRRAKKETGVVADPAGEGIGSADEAGASVTQSEDQINNGITPKPLPDDNNQVPWWETLRYEKTSSSGGNNSAKQLEAVGGDHSKADAEEWITGGPHISETALKSSDDGLAAVFDTALAASSAHLLSTKEISVASLEGTEASTGTSDMSSESSASSRTSLSTEETAVASSEVTETSTGTSDMSSESSASSRTSMGTEDQQQEEIMQTAGSESASDKTDDATEVSTGGNSLVSDGAPTLQDAADPEVASDSEVTPNVDGSEGRISAANVEAQIPLDVADATSKATERETQAEPPSVSTETRETVSIAGDKEDDRLTTNTTVVVSEVASSDTVAKALETEKEEKSAPSPAKSGSYKGLNKQDRLKNKLRNLLKFSSKK